MATQTKVGGTVLHYYYYNDMGKLTSISASDLAGVIGTMAQTYDSYTFIRWLVEQETRKSYDLPGGNHAGAMGPRFASR